MHRNHHWHGCIITAMHDLTQPLTHSPHVEVAFIAEELAVRVHDSLRCEQGVPRVGAGTRLRAALAPHLRSDGRPDAIRTHQHVEALELLAIRRGDVHGAI